VGQLRFCRDGGRIRESGAIGRPTAAQPVLTTIGCLATVGLEPEAEPESREAVHGTTSFLERRDIVYPDRYTPQRFIFGLVKRLL
jgi:hypothetical protein